MFVLQDSLETKRRGKPVYCGGMSAIGPIYTTERSEAIEFESKPDACKHPAYAHSLCFFNPVETSSLSAREAISK